MVKHGGMHGVRMAQAYKGCLGALLQRGPGLRGRGPGQVVRVQIPPETESLLQVGGPKEEQNLHTYLQNVSLFKMEIGW